VNACFHSKMSGAGGSLLFARVDFPLVFVESFSMEEEGGNRGSGLSINTPVRFCEAFAGRGRLALFNRQRSKP
jgi:hypothetical protein